jgi:hypothetical protein
VWLGHVSYSLYLVHAPVLAASVVLLHEQLPIWACVAVGAAAALAAAEAMRRLVEAPSRDLARWAERRLRRTRPAAAPRGSRRRGAPGGHLGRRGRLVRRPGGGRGRGGSRDARRASPRADAHKPLREFLAGQTVSALSLRALLSGPPPGHRWPEPTPTARPDRPADRPFARVRRFASPAVKAALLRRWREFLGVVCGLAGLALLVALASHDPADPSFSTATARGAANLAGPLGAHASDVLLQGFGGAALLPAPRCSPGAWRLGSHRGLGLFPARVRRCERRCPCWPPAERCAARCRPGPGGAGRRFRRDRLSAVCRGLAEAALGSSAAGR